MIYVLAVLLLLNSDASGSDITAAVFGKDTSGVPAAFGDFNSDELTDLFVIRGNSVVILLNTNYEEPLLQSTRLTCNFSCPITSIVPGDFNGDALMDVLVSTSCSKSDEFLKITILWGNLTKITCSDEHIFKTRGEPLALDYNDDFITDLFGENEEGERMFWEFSKEGTFTRIPFGKKLGHFNPSPLRRPHSNAYIDLNDDCIADLFITSEGKQKKASGHFFEIWQGVKDERKYHNETVLIPPPAEYLEKLGQSVFLDVELQGKMDHILPLKTSKESKLFVYLSNSNSWHDLNLELTDKTGVVWQWASDENIPFLEAITIRAGDFNMDGYPDLLAPLVSPSGAYQTVLLQNSPCTDKCGNFTRSFKPQWNMFRPYGNDSVAGAFFDIFQDGVMDVILVYKKGDVFSMGAFKNNLDYDANFVKVMVLSGLHNELVPFVVTPLGKKKRTFGSNLPGPRIWYRTLDQDGNSRAGVSAQIPQSAHFALSLPYTTFALGRIPNFVDSVGVGFASYSREWPQLIPNSQIVVIPDPMDIPGKWKVQFFVTPSKIVLMSFVALVGTCVVIILGIAFLHWKEKRTDRLERLDSIRFNFDAM